MKLIIKLPPPASFITYSNTKGTSFEDMDANVKEDLKKSLLNEQGWICGYCQQKIKDESKMKIEHHCEQSICNGQAGNPDRRLDYTNLMAVCLGHYGDDLHCDSKKATYNSTNGLPIQVSPWTPAHVAGIKYTSNGKIESISADHSREIDEILNLNISYIKDQRKDLWIKLFSLTNSAGKGYDRNKMRRLLQSRVSKNGNQYDEAFPGLYEYMLKKFC